ncbi:MAG TPA: putative Ig domain-containing protein [Marmoricola sp.]|nr:putative Ig domain-containing protein [Marmoricola sp.]
MSAHRPAHRALADPAHRGRPREHRRARRTFTAALLAVVAGTGYLAAAGPAAAANTWNVAPGGAVNNTCGAVATPCGSLQALLTRGTNPVVSGDTINVAAGTYTDHPSFSVNKAVTVNGVGAVTFDGGNAGTVFTVNVGFANTLTLNNITLTKGKGTTATSGGALTVSSGKVVTSGVNLTASTTTNNGGGAYVSGANAASLSMNGGTVSGNSAPNGGGIYTAGGAVTLTTTTLSGNSGAIGGGLYVLGAATLTNATISGNTVTNSGGGIATGGTTNVTGGSITGNSAPNGGGVFNNIGSTTLTNVALTGNTGTSLGGGFYNTGAGAVLTTSGGSVSNNTALNGGAGYNGSSATIDGTTLTGNTANGGTTSSGGNGGAIYNSAALTVKGATFNANKVVADTNASPGVTGFGGAVFSASLAASGAPTLTFLNTTINGDNAGTPVAGGNATYGGAIVAAGNLGVGGANTVTTATNLTLSKNVAQVAGGLYTSGTTTLTNSTLTQNKATHASAGIGGGLYAVQSGTAPTITLDHTDVTANDGVAGGGGLVLGTGVTTTVKNGSNVSSNTGALGAGIFNGGALSVQGSHVDDNSATNSGGGIYSSTSVTLSNSSVDGNSAAFLGGGLSTSTSAGGFTVTGGTVSGNDAFGAGGAFISDNLVASFDGTDFIGNTSTGANFGGGAILSGGKVTVDHATISGNTADGSSGSGGAIFSGSSNENVATTLKVSNSTITDNESFVGSAIFAGSSKDTSTNKVSVTNTTIHANAASGPFGAIETTAPMSILGSTITDNTAVPTNPFDAYGGIVAGSAGLVSVSGSIVSGNNGHQCNAAIADGGYNLNSPTASECAFSAGRNDVLASPQLGALAANGGPTQTRLPGPASPALDRVPAGTATGVSDAVTGASLTLCGAGATDQRGTGRPQGARCDIGAVEADQIVPTIDGPTDADYSVGSAGTPLVYTTTGSPQPTLSATGLPSGVTMHDNGDGTGTISGTPAAGTGATYTVTVTASNEAGSDTTTLTLVVHQAPVISGPATATYTVGQPGGPTTFTQTTGHPLGLFSSIGSLPAGVGFDASVAGQGTYSGTPAAGTGGVYNLTVKDSNGTPPDATVPFALTVDEAPGLTRPGTATFKVGTSSQSAEFTATGFPVPTLTQTGLPAGLSLTSTGAGKAKISGNAANGTGGVYPVTVRAANGVGTDATADVSVTVNEAPELIGPSEARFVTGSANAIGFSSDGYPEASIAVTGAVPAWLDVQDNGNGSVTLSGTAPANAVGTYAITITASNGQSPDAVVHLTLEVVPPLSISTTTLPNAAYRTAYSAQVTAAGGQPAYSFQVVSGSLPAGLTMSSFGLITGATTASPGTYAFTVKATDSANPAQTDTKVLSIKVEKGATNLVVDPVVIQKSGLNIKFGIVSATLTGGFPPAGVSGQVINFYTGTTKVCTGTTDANGRVARCEVSLLNTLKIVSNGRVSATYPGNTFWLPSNGSAGLIG